jgi:hypothetical protein
MSQILPTNGVQRKHTSLIKFTHIFEYSLACALTISWVAFHIRFFLHAGALWRDEINSVNLATSPTISGIAANLQHDSFPILWLLLLRFWIQSGIGSTDQGIRVLGLLAGLGTAAVLWSNARRFRYPTPLAALTLLGFSAAVLCYGDSIRGYGLGVLLGLIMLGLLWDVAVRPTLARIIAALLVSLAAVQTLYYNSVILLAVGCGAALVASRHRRWNRAACIAAIGAICALSMVPYRWVEIRARSFRPMLLHPVTPSWLWFKFNEAVGFDWGNVAQRHQHDGFIWPAAVVLALLASIAAVVRPFKPALPDSDVQFRRDVLTFHLTTLFVGVATYITFLYTLSYIMAPWYFLSLLALIATCIDGLFSALPAVGGRLLLGAASIAFCCTNGPGLWYDSALRKTSMDQACTILQYEAGPGDLIVIIPWYLGLPFQRYYHGQAPYVTVPQVDFLAYQKFELLLDPMRNPRAMNPTISRIEQTLRAGHCVYLLGDNEFPYFGTAPITIQPAPDPIAGWNDGAYYHAWATQITFFLMHHARLAKQFDVPREGVSDAERPALWALKQWVPAPQSFPQRR